MIKTDGLSEIYSGNSAVQDVAICVPKGQIYGLLGRNGFGKITIYVLKNIFAKTGYSAQLPKELQRSGLKNLLLEVRMQNGVAKTKMK